ncbi:hypothetical protein CHCC14820_3374 [Bacillus paralicheniformis]|uniref:Uncharacterized protein n=1 Tax=Bacillus paralicheniformis TaxID=1648923 RepID=A0ABY3FRN9_9BACI|nr:hypothetical protein SC10_B2orf04637 [Bacillus paralicheniformis]TWK85981.1 hypothetical protein CHCC20331_1134 [Bacillus paralicheniformis]TWL33797.1 hypothetical protein CHCC15381_0304 [Bacillus paralicheniformis]TWM06500.1 hypothetical protein CHCC15136_4079 [Bacillus paralicheniformis]TWM37476.1 hypothetical protein CHCC14820_3374 [Bacillus paralicheniformis]
MTALHLFNVKPAGKTNGFFPRFGDAPLSAFFIGIHLPHQAYS